MIHRLRSFALTLCLAATATLAVVPIATVQGGTVVVDAALGITDARGRTARIVATDLVARNGVIHVIDKVLLPAP